MRQITVVLVDDHVLLRKGLKLLLEKESSIKVVGEASDGEEALHVLEETKPHIVILDISMPNLDGIECIKEIRNRGLKTKIIVLTMHSDEHYIREVMGAGAMGFVQKASVDTELFLAIKQVADGDIYLNKKDAHAILSMLIADPPHDTEDDDPYKILSAREREVLKLLVRGFTLKEIADMLYLSVKTVDTYKTRIMHKLNYTKKNELVNYALKYSFLSEKQETQ